MSRHVAFRSARAASALGLAIAVTSGILPAYADTSDPWDGNWHGSITPYGWLPGMTGETRYQLPNGPTVSTKSDNDLFSTLSGAFMLEGDMRKGNWCMYGDIDWVKFSNENGHFTSIGGDRIGANAKLDTRWGIKGGMVNFAGLYRALGLSRRESHCLPPRCPPAPRSPEAIPAQGRADTLS